MTAPRNSHISEKPLDSPDEHLMLQHRLRAPANLDPPGRAPVPGRRREFAETRSGAVLFPGPRYPTGCVGPRRAQPTISHPGERHHEVPVAPLWLTRRPQAPLPLRRWSRESRGFRSPRSRAATLKHCCWATAHRLPTPRRSVSLTIARKIRAARHASALSLATTSSSEVSVVRVP